MYNGPHDVSVKDVPDAKIERPTDVLVRITATNICGSDLHMYEGRTDFETGRTFGHENMGEVIEVGDGVDKVKVGERVVLPFNISCGFCKNCERGLTNYCLTTQPDPGSGRRGLWLRGDGPWAGGRRKCCGCRTATTIAFAWARTPGEGERLRHALRHLSHRLPRHRDGRGRPRGLRGDLRCRPGS
ncbi:alcohol dehydrogenase catalytic domain-containing protein [Arthrobacter sp. JCM 19049]|uniref:alcohol dehydrogenase catalytic domain-containing protein n=1 Tax=Arthrobacter sp. JCM 19049 TaxID=1460643 RepID=UPI0024367831|nr:alcohol dehydrogenase catalytic domain-containing protein [Arthrobacter sp. JCM 19049]